MNLINLKIATAVAAVLTTIASLAPQAAYAQRAASGSSSAAYSTYINFILNSSDTDSNPNDNIGEYREGIQNFSVNFNTGAPIDLPPNLSAPLAPVTLNVSRIDPQPGSTISLPGLPSFNYDSLTYIGDSTAPSNQQGFESGAVVYQALFNAPNNTNNLLTFFIPSTGNEASDFELLVNSLSGVDRFRGGIPGVLTTTSTNINFSSNACFYFGYSIGSTSGCDSGGGPISLGAVEPIPDPSDVEAIPEPSGTAGLLAFGAMGAISMLRRNRRFSKNLSNRNATLSSQGGRPPL